MKIIRNFYNYNTKIKTYNHSEFRKLIYGSGGQANDKTIFHRIKYLHHTDFDFVINDEQFYYIVLFKGKKIIGIAKLGYYPNSSKSETEYGISFLSIDKDYRGRGYSHLLVDNMFKLASEKGLDVATSLYTYAGFTKLKPLFNKYANKYNVQFRDKDGKSLMDAKWMYDDKINLLPKYE